MGIVIVGMLDEREEALGVIRNCIEQRGHKTCLIDISVGTGAIVPTLKPDVSCLELTRLAEEDAGAAFAQERELTSVVAHGLKAKIRELHAHGDLQAIVAITGMTGALISLPAMVELPFGIPKLLISGATGQPAHAAKFGDFFARRDITVMHTVVDTVGMNPLVRSLALNGAHAISGMVEGGMTSLDGNKPCIALTEFGYCDKGAHHIRQILGGEYEVVSIHAMGMGDKAALDLAPQGFFDAFVDLVPGAFSEHLLGGNRDAGPDRLDFAATLPIPYVFCPGGFDMISCGPLERRDKGDSLWTSRRLAERKLYIQPPRVQARTSAEEMEYVAAETADRLNRYQNKARVKVVVPLRGFSSLSLEGGPLHDPVSDRAFIRALRSRLAPEIEVIEVDADINSPVFARAVADALSRAFREVHA
jgi:uncharacterized protein (UPF0261 family)